MKKGVIIFTALAIMLLASLSLFAQYGRGYGRGGYGRGGYGRGNYCGYNSGYGRYNNSDYRYNNGYRGNYNGCYYYNAQ
ncbi:hypothetical protein [Brachyspira murdochii]|uniref:Uncharacterized protein n=2 Tax=Brachyspira TaxID=29521 RepID=A0ABX5B9H7_9SPIR|nr:hypothetical protein [Brachyspira murdochii]PPS22787.1 hypothetical protein DJ52_02580 [Brachyspira murdochii]